jgi:hypothetical protein
MRRIVYYATIPGLVGVSMMPSGRIFQMRFAMAWPASLRAAFAGVLALEKLKGDVFNFRP